jgi:uncharacterized protein (TIGR02453 family)
MIGHKGDLAPYSEGKSDQDYGYGYLKNHQVNKMFWTVEKRPVGNNPARLALPWANTIFTMKDFTPTLMFSGFPKGTFTFLRGLSRDNSKVWFDAHRKEYELYYMEPARQFVAALGPRLMEIEPGVRYEPKVNKSIFRINRDIRFSKDKTPYKDHIDLWFWLGDHKGWDTGGFFIRITPRDLILGAGIHYFEKERLRAFRNSILDSGKGYALAAILKSLEKQKGYQIGGARRKTIPKGFDPSHERSSMLLYEGLTVMFETRHPAQIASKDFIRYCYTHFKRMAPLNAWLQEAVS